MTRGSQAKPTARQRALNAGEEFYDSGVPCKFGHRSLRRVSNGSCLECNRRVVLTERQRYHRAQQARERKRLGTLAIETLAALGIAQFNRKEDRHARKRVWPRRPRWRSALV
jgi:hypothetical protein